MRLRPSSKNHRPESQTGSVIRHDVSFDEAATVFADENARLMHDPDHSQDEDRFILRSRALFPGRQCIESGGQRREQAVAADPGVDHGGLFGPGLLGYCYARSGRSKEARRVLDDLDALRQRSCAQATALAAICPGPGERDRALGWLERAFEEHCGALAWVGHDPLRDSLREEPRFQALLRTMNLAS